jgi:hypothetical protein
MPLLLAFIHKLQKLFLIALSYTVLICPAQPLKNENNNNSQPHQISNLLQLLPHPKTRMAMPQLRQLIKGFQLRWPSLIQGQVIWDLR